MIRKSATLDDIAESISDLGTMIAKSILDLGARMDKRFIGVDGKLDGVEGRLTALEVRQRETSERLERVEGETQALRNDVRELYLLVD